MTLPIRLCHAAIKQPIRHIPIHTFLLAAYPIVSLIGFNISQTYANEGFKFLLISLSVSALVLGGLKILTKNWPLAGLLASLLVIWFFNYGRLYVPLKSLSVFGLLIGRHRYLVVAWSGMILAAAFWLKNKPRAIPDLTMILNVFSSILIFLPIIQIGAFYLSNLDLPRPQKIISDNSVLSWTETTPPPDIYYIVLDAYTRSDVLEQEFGINNTKFLGELRQLGFYIADCAQSNYSRTIDSLTSVFNMDYVQALKPELKIDQQRAGLVPDLKHSVVRQQLEQLGYKTIVFKNPWERLIWDDAAIVFRSSGSGLLSPIEYLLLRTTIVRVYLDVRLSESRQIANQTNYEDTLYALRQLPKVPDIPGPKFVFVHLIIPHSPFVFGPDGEKIDIPYDADAGNIYTEEDYRQGYAAAVSYINSRMNEIVPELIRASTTPPIIILTGDHGTPWGGSLNAVRILGAFFTPEARAPFYKTITPVNIFRIVFNTFYNGSFNILPDRSFISEQNAYLDLGENTNACSESD